MGSFTVLHWLILLINVCIIVVPCWKIIQRVGFPGMWSLLLFVPLVNVIALWVFAFIEWPVQTQDS
jgi:hypothetical protein